MDCLSYTIRVGSPASESVTGGGTPWPAPTGSGTIGAQHLGLRDQVLSELRQRIVNGDYPPGERLTEDRLAADFGVSRNPVREALRIVATEGFVEMVPRRGAFVATPDESTIADMFAVRERLETLAARLAAERATPADVADLRALLEAAREATERVDFSRVAELNSELHLRVIAISGNRWLSAISSALYLHVHWVFRIGAAHRAPHSWVEHIRLVDAIEAGDADAAEAAAGAHVHAAGVAALDRVEDHARGPHRRRAPGTPSAQRPRNTAALTARGARTGAVSGRRHSPASRAGSPRRRASRSPGRG